MHRRVVRWSFSYNFWLLDDCSIMQTLSRDRRTTTAKKKNKTKRKTKSNVWCFRMLWKAEKRFWNDVEEQTFRFLWSPDATATLVKQNYHRHQIELLVVVLLLSSLLSSLLSLSLYLCHCSCGFFNDFSSTCVYWNMHNMGVKRTCTLNLSIGSKVWVFYHFCHIWPLTFQLCACDVLLEL